MVVDADACVDPGAVVVFAGHAAGAALTVFAPEGLADHARGAEVGFVKGVVAD